MIKIYLAILFFLFQGNIIAQQPPKLIVRGDDMGFSHSGNLALIKAYKEGIETSIEVIVPSPWFPEAVKLLRDHPGVDVGIHLALTSEWDNVKWRPLTDCGSLKDSNGYFLPMVFPNKNYPGQSLSENKWNIGDIEKEFRAQIETALKFIPRISHVSAHMGCTELDAVVKQLTDKLVKEYNLDFKAGNLKGMKGWDSDDRSSGERIDAFIAALNSLQPGNTYVFVEHPGLDDPELRAISHIGYENVAADRQAVTDVFTSDKVKAAIKKRKIVLISFRDLK